MLFLKRFMLLLMLCLTTAAVHAQQKKAACAAVFTNLSNIINLSEATLSGIMQMNKGQDVEINFSQHFNFPGKVLSNKNIYDNLQTLIIKSSSYNNALLQLSRQVNEDKSVFYVGRIFNAGGQDGYELKKTAEGIYHFIKFKTANILQDCELH